MAIAQNFPEIRPSLNLDFSNVKALDPRVTFARASSATYYGTQTAKAEENLLIRSQEFDDGVWSKSANATVTANDQTAPDGTTTADTIGLPENNSRLTQNLTVRAGEYTASVFLKGTVGETTRIELGGISNATQVTFTGDWQRVSVTATLAAGATTFVIIRRTGSGDTAASFAAWGAQLEQRSAVTAYTPTTTQPITRFQPVLESEPAGVARFDHNPLTFESLGLLVEEQRTNLFLRSEEFDNAGWSKSNATITANTIVAPDGELTADQYVPTTSNSDHFVTQSLTPTAALHTFSVYAKAGGHSFLRMSMSASDSPVTYFNLITGAVGTTSGSTPSIVAVGNGWYRCSITGTTSAASSSFVVRSGTADNFTTSFAGDGFSGIFIWGAQLEAGGFPTSYIKTVASQVTRSADSASMVGANFLSWYRQDEGTLYGDALFGDLTSGRLLASITGAVNADRLTIGLGGIYSAASVVDNSVQANLSFGTKTANSKIAFAYKVNDFAASGNGSSVSTDTSGTLPVVDRLFIGSRVDLNPVVIANGHIRKLAYYPQRLTNAQLQALTG